MAEEHKQAMIPEGEDVEVKDRGFFDFMKKDEEEKKEQCHEEPGEVGLEEGLENMSVGEKKAEEEDKKKEEEGEEKKDKHGLHGKLHRSSSSSSSSSSDEEEVIDENGEKKKKKKKGLKDKVKDKLHGEKKEDEHESNDKKMVDKIKDKLPGEHEKSEEEHTDAATAAPPPPVEECVAAQQANEEHKDVPKKGFLEKIKEKLPGQHKKTEEASEAAGEKTPPPLAQECSPEQLTKEHEGEHKKGFLEKIKERLPGHNKKTEEETPAAASTQ